MNSQLPRLAVTGATGAVGGRVARRLADAGVEQRLVVRRGSEPATHDGAVTVEVADYGDMASMTAALQGVGDLFLVSFREERDRLQAHFRAVDAAVSAGVERIVYLSFLNASADSTFLLGQQHYATEQHIIASGIDHVFLRSSLYADFVPFFTGEGGVIRAPAGAGKVSWVCRDDIADTVVAVLLEPGTRREIYENTGPQALDLHETADVLSHVVGREIRYVPETEEEAWVSRRPTGAEDWEIAGWISSYLAIANGELELVSDAVETLTGRPPVDLETYLSQNPDLWGHLRS